MNNPIKEGSAKAAARKSGRQSNSQSYSRKRPQSPSRPPLGTGGRAARDAAVEALLGVLVQGRAFDDVLAKSVDKRNLEPRDRAFARAVAAAALRNRGSLLHVITKFLQKPLPKDTGRLEPILLSAAAQLIVLKTPPHAAISIAVDQTRVDQKARRFDKLANAVLRRVSENGVAILHESDQPQLDIPAWMYARWVNAYGAEVAHAIAAASLTEAALDLTPKSDAEAWAEKLGGQLLPTGSIRLAAGGRIEDLAGFSEGAWWVQDAAAALPVKLLGDVRDLSVADLCAAPGGKTAQLAAAGADVTAVDVSQDRLQRLRDNLARLNLKAKTVAADATTWSPAAPFDAILVDAPCTATGTIRRHPDILHLKRPEDAAQLAAIQSAILEAAAAALKPGGRLVYCTCSLEPEEGQGQIERFLAAHKEFSRKPVDQGAIGGWQQMITPDGDLRTLPSHLEAMPEGQRGLDGFYAAVLVKAI